MPEPENTIMQKEEHIKDDGRLLIYYRFVPAGSEPTPENGAASEHGEG